MIDSDAIKLQVVNSKLKKLNGKILFPTKIQHNGVQVYGLKYHYFLGRGHNYNIGTGRFDQKNFTHACYLYTVEGQDFKFIQTKAEWILVTKKQGPNIVSIQHRLLRSTRWMKQNGNIKLLNHQGDVMIELSEYFLPNCRICWQPIKKQKKLKCGDIFHQHCILNWCKNYNNFCPVCYKDKDGKTMLQFDSQQKYTNKQ